MSARFWHKAAPQEFSFLASAQMFGFGTKIGQKVDDDGDDDAEQSTGSLNLTPQSLI